MDRKDYNILIAHEVLLACQNPANQDLRFGQILANMNILQYEEKDGVTLPIDIYNVESETIAERLKAI